MGNQVSVTESDVTIHPVDYVIADFQAFEMLLRGALKKGINSKSIMPRSFKMYFSIPTNATETERRAYRDSAEHAGATEVYMIFQSCCAAVGLTLLFEQKNFVVVDFGSGKIEMTVFGNSLPLATAVVRMGTTKISKLLKNFLRRTYKLTVTDRDVDLMLTGLSKSVDEIKVQHVTVKVKEIHELLDKFFFLVNDEFMEAIEQNIGHQGIHKAMASGIYFTGGGSAMEVLREKIMPGNGVQRMVSQNPLLDNINGLKKIMADRERFKHYTIV